jgi:thioredoxin 1
MNQGPQSTSFSPPWFLLIGLLAGGAFLLFMMGDSLPFLKSKTAHSPNVIELTSTNWDKEVVQSGVPVLVDFWAPWCAPCVQLSPTIDKLADRYVGKAKIGKVNVDEQKKIAAKYQIGGIPCVMIFHGNEQPSHILEGLRHEMEYVRVIDAELAKK